MKKNEGRVVTVVVKGQRLLIERVIEGASGKITAVLKGGGEVTYRPPAANLIRDAFKLKVEPIPQVNPAPQVKPAQPVVNPAQQVKTALPVKPAQRRSIFAKKQ